MLESRPSAQASAREHLMNGRALLSTGRINEAIASRLNVPMERMPGNIDRFGNTSAATIPILMDEMRRDGRLKSGQLVCIAALGAGKRPSDDRAVACLPESSAAPQTRRPDARGAASGAIHDQVLEQHQDHGDDRPAALLVAAR